MIYFFLSSLLSFKKYTINYCQRDWFLSFLLNGFYSCGQVMRIIYIFLFNAIFLSWSLNQGFTAHNTAPQNSIIPQSLMSYWYKLLMNSEFARTFPSLYIGSLQIKASRIFLTGGVGWSPILHYQFFYFVGNLFFFCFDKVKEIFSFIFNFYSLHLGPIFI